MPIRSSDVIITSFQTGGSSGGDEGDKGSASFDVTVTIDADPTDDLPGLTILFEDVSSPGAIMSLFGPAKAAGKGKAGSPGSEKLADLAALVEKTKMAYTGEDALVFTAGEDGTVVGGGPYFCDDNGDGLIVGDPEKRFLIDPTSVDPADNTPVSDDGFIDVLLLALEDPGDLPG